MQFLPIYLYDQTFNVILDLDATTRGVNRVMYQHDLKVQKGIKNEIRIQFKNSDQKRISVADKSFVFSVIDPATQRLVMEKSLELVEETTSTRGVALLTLNESDTLDLDKNSYTFSVKAIDTDGSYTPTYANTYYGQAGTLHISTDVQPVLQPSQEISAFTRAFNSANNRYEFKSGNIYAYPEYNKNLGLHTIAVYMTEFKGTLEIQGTLDNSPGSSGRYSTIISKTYNGSTGIDYFNFNGVYTYIRLVYSPDPVNIGPSELPTQTSGTIDKALYRY